ncbi:unnamed protein product [Victoria cruziana]
MSWKTRWCNGPNGLLGLPLFASYYLVLESECKKTLGSNDEYNLLKLLRRTRLWR